VPGTVVTSQTPQVQAILDLFATSLSRIYASGSLNISIPAFPSSLATALMTAPIVSFRASLFNYTTLSSLAFQAASLQPTDVLGITLAAAAVQFAVTRRGSSYYVSAVLAGSGTIAGKRFTLSLPFNSPKAAPASFRFAGLTVNGASLRQLASTPG
jgi:hypothetical protein